MGAMIGVPRKQSEQNRHRMELLTEFRQCIVNPDHMPLVLMSHNDQNDEKLACVECKGLSQKKKKKKLHHAFCRHRLFCVNVYCFLFIC